MHYICMLHTVCIFAYLHDVFADIWRGIWIFLQKESWQNIDSERSYKPLNYWATPPLTWNLIGRS